MTNPEQQAQAFLNDLLRDVSALVAQRIAAYKPNLAQGTGVLPVGAIPTSDPAFVSVISAIVAEVGGFVDPTTDPGDMIFRGASGIEALAIGDEGQVQTVVDGEPAWADATGGTSGTSSFIEYHQTSSQSFASSTEIRVNYDALIIDPDGLVANPSTAWEYTCPIDGIYDLRAGMQTNGGSWYMFAWKNGARFRTMTYSESGTDAGQALIPCSAGDTLHVRLYVTSGGVSSQIYVEHMWIVIYARG